MAVCTIGDCSNPPHTDSVRGYCERHHRNHQRALNEEYFSVPTVLAERHAKAQQGNWYPACGGTETPFHTRTGRRLLYCWQPSTGRHAYLDLDTDLILTDEESRIALGSV